ncbi:MAG: hypothetical protein ABJC09_06105 [Terriglobia bacterium]
MRNLLFATLLMPAVILAQDTVAPTTGEKVGPVRGENKGDYNIVQSWEFGYRLASIGGNEGKYRSDVNYRNGLRLLSSYLTVNSADGHGKWFDEIVLSTQGLGNDPYESATVRVQKNRLYRYDMLWRQNEYFNPGLTVASGQHLEDTTHRWQDHELTLFPQGSFRIRAGYGRVTQKGAALTTEQEFDSRSPIFPIFRNITQQFDDYRLGGDVLLKGFRLTIQRRWEYFKEDTNDTGPAAAGLTGFTRAQPFRGNTPSWMGNLNAERTWFTVNARLTYANGRGRFAQNETAMGPDRFGASQNRQIVISGNGDRPIATGDFNVSVFPLSKFTLVNHTSVSNTRIEGSNFYQQFDNSTFSFDAINFQFLGVRLITNATDARYRFSKTFDIFAGFRYADRLIRSTEDLASPGSPLAGVTAEQSNHTKAGVAGASWLPMKNVRLHLEAELGRNDNPFTPVSLRNYHALRSKIQYRTKTLTAGATYQENYNNNSIVITAYSSRARIYSADASWNARSWVSIDGSYSKLHLDTIGGLDFFAGSPRSTEITGAQSLYVSNIHAANLGLRFALKNRTDLYVGYNITKDTGDGRAALAPQADPVSQVLYNVQTFPLTYQTPLLRLSVRITDKLRYNVGYQYYGYKEDFGLFGINQNYRAQTGYTSLLWSF